MLAVLCDASSLHRSTIHQLKPVFCSIPQPQTLYQSHRVKCSFPRRAGLQPSCSIFTSPHFYAKLHPHAAVFLNIRRRTLTNDVFRAFRSTLTLLAVWSRHCTVLSLRPHTVAVLKTSTQSLSTRQPGEVYLPIHFLTAPSCLSCSFTEFACIQVSSPARKKSLPFVLQKKRERMVYHTSCTVPQT